VNRKQARGARKAVGVPGPRSYRVKYRKQARGARKAVGVPGPRSYRVKYDAAHVGSLAFTPEEVSTLLARVANVRDSAILELAVSTGIRREDLVAIRLEGLDLERGFLTFYESKKARTRTVPVDGRTLVTLRRYVETHRRGADASPWLFPGGRRDRRETERGLSASQHHLSGFAAWGILRKWTTAAGLPPRPFHALRATCYKLCKARGWSVEQASALIGDTVRTAAEVYVVATPGELKEAARERPILT
jgi:integrase